MFQCISAYLLGIGSLFSFFTSCNPDETDTDTDSIADSDSTVSTDSTDNNDSEGTDSDSISDTGTASLDSSAGDIESDNIDDTDVDTTSAEIPPQILSSDLSVHYIMRTPRFAQVPIVYDPPGYNPTLSTDAVEEKQWPDVGETVTFTAQVGNQGEASTPNVGYRWMLNGVSVATGVLPPLSAGETTEVSWDWSWADGSHQVSFELIGDGGGIDDGHPINNVREQQTNALLLTAYIWENFAQWMETHENAVGTRSAADWIQYHIDEMNHLFETSVSSLAPDGVQVRMAVDRMISVPTDTPDPGGTHAPEACPTDGCWGFGGPDPSTWETWISEKVSQRDNGLLHEWGHQLGLIDLYQMDIQTSECLITVNNPDIRSDSNSSAGAELDQLFDGDLTAPLATYESRPVWFALTFAEPQTFDHIRVRFSNEQSYEWQVFTADSLDDAIQRTGTSVQQGKSAVIENVSDFSNIAFAPAAATVWIIHVNRTDRDSMTHVVEWELWNDDMQLDTLQLLKTQRVAGTAPMPVVRWDVVHYNSISDDLMSNADYLLAPYHQWALNSDAVFDNRALPLRRGWYGRYLRHIPTQNTLVITQSKTPIADATLKIYQQQDGIIPNIPKYTGTTNQQGEFAIPYETTQEYAALFDLTEPLYTPFPISTIYSDLPHVVGTNSVLVIQITLPSGKTDYRFLDTPQLNLEFARGHETNGLYSIELDSQ